MSLIVAAAPARVDPASFIAFLGYVKDGYDAFDKYILSNDPSEIAQVQAIVNQAKARIIAELDGLTAAWNSSCAANSVDTFLNIDHLTTENLQAFAISSDNASRTPKRRSGRSRIKLPSTRSVSH